MECKVISLADYRKTRRAQARILKRLIERHLAEAGRVLSHEEREQPNYRGPHRDCAEE